MKCPDCEAPVEISTASIVMKAREADGSEAYPHINVCHCTACRWRALACGNPSCDGYLVPGERADEVLRISHYACALCGWAVTGPPPAALGWAA